MERAAPYKIPEWTLSFFAVRSASSRNSSSAQTSTSKILGSRDAAAGQIPHRAPLRKLRVAGFGMRSREGLSRVSLEKASGGIASFNPHETSFRGLRPRNLLRPSVHEVIHFAGVKRYWCYIISNKSRRLYTGFTDDLFRRVIEHREKLFPDSFTARYCFDTLVFYEEYAHAISARTREIEIKGWRREKKLKLILAENPYWADLSSEWKDNPGWELTPGAHPRLKRKKIQSS